jgi:hypothetical protein
MNLSEFKAYLKSKDIDFSEGDGELIIKAGGYLYLSSLTTIPEGVTISAGGNLDLSSLTTIPEGVTISAGGDLDLSSLTTIPEGVTISAGGDLDLRSLTTIPEGVKGNQPYIDVFLKPDNNNDVIIYKRVSNQFKTQENTPQETRWTPGTTVEHDAWNPSHSECGAGKFHACAVPFWCDVFRSKRDDRYVKIAVNKEDLFDWRSTGGTPNYPSKIAFRKGTVLCEVDRFGEEVTLLESTAEKS